MRLFTSRSPADPYESQRHALVDSFTRGPKPRIGDPRVLDVMRTIPRHLFMPDAERSQAYRDIPLPIGGGQTISQPSLVAYMTEQLQLQPDDRVLEVGTGSGYQTAVLSPLVGAVYTLEIVEPLARRAAKTLEKIAYNNNIFFRIGSGKNGWPEAAPFDAIIVTCAPDSIPSPLIKQLREGGRMVIPVGAENTVQQLYLLEKTNGKIKRKSILQVRFVPMT